MVKTQNSNLGRLQQIVRVSEFLGFLLCHWCHFDLFSNIWRSKVVLLVRYFIKQDQQTFDIFLKKELYYYYRGFQHKFTDIKS